MYDLKEGFWKVTEVSTFKFVSSNNLMIIVQYFTFMKIEIIPVCSAKW